MRLSTTACIIVAALAAGGCGDDPQAAPPTVNSVVQKFFQDAVDKDAESICSVMTPNGRARAAGRTFYQVPRGESQATARPRRPASYDQCVESGAPGATKSSDLPIAMKNGYRPRVIKTRRSPEGVR